ncbi:mitochondrial 2-enoyl thioester reductase [Mycoblastus sanguinarius]|nr:mitochondrial 2-enoyl thioester reductase [Mycoblastus sanguinarius]
MPLKPPPISLSTAWRQCLKSRYPSNRSFNRKIVRRHPISTYGYTQAKALVYSKHGSPNDVLSLHTHSLSPPHSSLLTLRTLTAPLNPADINQIQGTYPTAPPFTTTLGTPTPSAVPGNEGCFEVLSTGSFAKSVRPGDWVIARQTGLGTWRTHMQVDEEQVVRVEKDKLSAQQVGTVSVNPVTAWRLLKDFVALREGEWFVHNGANSGVGRAAIQLGKRWGLKSIAVVRGRGGKVGEKLKRELEDLGAEKVVTDVEVADKGFKDRVKEWTNGGREEVKLALNCVGGDMAMAMAKVLSAGGCMVTYGAMSKAPMRVGASMLIFKDLRFEGFWVSRWGDRNPEEKKKTVDEILGLIREGEFKNVPTMEVKWDWDTKEEELVDAVQGTLEGFRKGKGIFVFGDT